MQIRSLKNYSPEKLIQELGKLNWNNVITCDNVNQAWDNFKGLFMSVVDSIAPIKEIRLKQCTEPWMCNEILEGIRERDKSLYNFKKQRTAENFKTFCLLRNKLQQLIKSAKRTYFNDKIEECKNSSTDLWKAFKNLGISKTTKGSSNIGLEIENEISFDKKTVANTFNNFFTTIAENLVSKLPDISGGFGGSFIDNYYQNKGVKSNAFIFSPVSEDVISKLIGNLSIRKATSLDGLSARFLKDGESVIFSPFSHIINLSLRLGYVPDEMKTARVIPLYKKKSKTDPGNYRPVSILTKGYIQSN